MLSATVNRVASFQKYLCLGRFSLSEPDEEYISPFQPTPSTSMQNTPPPAYSKKGFAELKARKGLAFNRQVTESEVKWGRKLKAYDDKTRELEFKVKQGMQKVYRFVLAENGFFYF